MDSPRFRIAFVPLALGVFLLCCFSTLAQRVEPLVENPNAVRLQELWRLQGSNNEEIGFGVGSVGDLDGDSYGDWAAIVRGEWLLYRGGSTLSDEAFWRMDSVGLPPYQPVVGNFLGDATLWVGFMHAHLQKIDNVTSVYSDFRLYRSEGGTLPPSSSPTRVLKIGVGGCVKDVQAADLDGDGDDELIVARACDLPEIWIYEGGPNFQVETPTRVIVDPDSINGGQDFFIAMKDITGDHYPDLITSGDYRIWINGKPGSFYKTKLYFSSPTAPWSWEDADRVIEGAKLTADTTGVPITPSPLVSLLHDGNGDGIYDMIGTIQVGPESRQGSYLWLSGRGQDARTRAYDSTDWDEFLPSTEYFIDETPLGYLADSSGHWTSLPLNRRTDGYRYVLGSGEGGPNGTIDAIAGEARESMFSIGSPAGDVNGDGWDDVIFGNFSYRSRGGIAVIFGGGPYIPNDDPTVSVAEYPVAGESGGLYLWPNPVKDALHLAWKGNLKRMPARYVLCDVLGRMIVEGSLQKGRGDETLECSDFPPGAYLLSMFDNSGAVIATARMIKD